MRVDESRLSRVLRWIFYPAVAIAVFALCYTHYRHVTAASRAAYVRNGFDSLAIAADELGSTLDQWGMVVSRASVKRIPSRFKEYVRLLVPGLEPCDNMGSGTDTDVLTEKAQPATIKLSTPDRSKHFFRIEAGGCADASADKLFRKSIDDANKTFDDILLVRSNGEVVLQSSTIGNRLLRIDVALAASESESSEGASSPPLKATSKSSSSTESDLHSGALKSAEYEITHRFSETTDYPNLRNLEVAGQEYQAFIQPVKISNFQGAGTAEKSTDPPEADAHDQKLLIVGLISLGRLEAVSSEWPLSYVLWAALALVLLYSAFFSLSCVPMKSKLQPIRRYDVALMGFFALTCCAGVTLALTHGYFTWIGNRARIDANLTRLAARIDDNLREELCRLGHVLDGMTQSRDLAATLYASSYASSQEEMCLAQAENNDEQQSPTMRAFRCNLFERPPNTERNAIQTSIAKVGLQKPTATDAFAIAYSWPFFDYVFWATTDGKQIAKWTVRKEVTPQTNLLEFDWFKNVAGGRTFELRAQTAEQKRLLDDQPASVMVEPKWSPNTGEYLTFISKLYRFGSANDEKKDVVGVVAAKLASVTSPVLPPGYGFAIVNDTGTALFGSNPNRNRRENLFSATSFGSTMAEMARTDTERKFTGKYAGRDVRMLTRPMRALDYAPWTIVTYRDLKTDQDRGLRTFLNAMIFTLPHALVMLTLALCLRCAMRKGATGSVWPCVERVGEYWTLFLILLFATIFLWLMTFTASRRMVYVALLVLPGAAAVIAIMLLRGKYKVMMAFVMAFFIVAFANAVANARENAFSASDLLLTLLSVLMILTVAFRDRLAEDLKTGLSVIARWSPWFKDLIARQQECAWIRLYTVNCCLGVLIVAVVPTIAHYRLSYETVNTAGEMRDLVTLMQSLDRREAAANDYYREITLADQGDGTERDRFVRDRLSIRLDRYDSTVPAHALPVVAVPERQLSPNGLEALLSRIPILEYVTPAGYAGNAFRLPDAEPDADPLLNAPRQRFLDPRWAMLQLDYRMKSGPNDKTASSAKNDTVRWAYASIAHKLPSFADNGVLFYSAAVGLTIASYFIIYYTVQLLFFLKFPVPRSYQPIEPEKLLSLTRNSVVLGISGSGKSKLLNDLDAQYLDMWQLSGGKKWPAISHSEQPLIIDNFDFNLDSEEAAKLRLETLEKAIFVERRTTVLVCSVDVREYYSEILSGNSGASTPLARFLCSSETRWNKVMNTFVDTYLMEGCAENLVGGSDNTGFVRRIYQSCTDAQRAVMYQMSNDGFVNPHNRQAISALARRGWVRLSPRPVFSEKLRGIGKPLKDVIAREDVSRWRASSRRLSGWNGGGLAFASIFIIGVLVLAATFGSANLGVITGALGVLPVLLKVISELRTRASVSPPKDVEHA